jgi:Rieske Fe-S protein
MQRKDFLKTCAGGCFLAMGLGVAGSVARAAVFSFQKDDNAKLLQIPKERFVKGKKKKEKDKDKTEGQKKLESIENVVQSEDTALSLSPSRSDSTSRTLSRSLSNYRPYIVLDESPYEWPIVLYRFSDTEYSALLMRCTHQGSELSAHGEIMTCSAHGSEFDTRGQVVTGPAETPLQTFEVSTDETNVYIHLL